MNVAKLEQMKIEARGFPEKIARYTLAKREYDEEIADLFDKDANVSYTETPSEILVEIIEDRAKASGDGRAVRRAEILRSNYEYQTADRQKHFDWRDTKTQLSAKLRQGANVTQQDLQAAWSLAKQNSTIENRALYSQIKQAVEIGEEN